MSTDVIDLNKIEDQSGTQTIFHTTAVLMKISIEEIKQKSYKAGVEDLLFVRGRSWSVVQATVHTSFHPGNSAGCVILTKINSNQNLIRLPWCAVRNITRIYDDRPYLKNNYQLLLTVCIFGELIIQCVK